MPQPTVNPFGSATWRQYSNQSASRTTGEMTLGAFFRMVLSPDPRSVMPGWRKMELRIVYVPGRTWTVPPPRRKT